MLNNYGGYASKRSNGALLAMTLLLTVFADIGLKQFEYLTTMVGFWWGLTRNPNSVILVFVADQPALNYTS